MKDLDLKQKQQLAEQEKIAKARKEEEARQRAREAFEAKGEAPDDTCLEWVRWFAALDTELQGVEHVAERFLHFCLSNVSSVACPLKNIGTMYK